MLVVFVFNFLIGNPTQTVYNGTFSHVNNEFNLTNQCVLNMSRFHLEERLNNKMAMTGQQHNTR